MWGLFQKRYLFIDCIFFFPFKILFYGNYIFLQLFTLWSRSQSWKNISEEIQCAILSSLLCMLGKEEPRSDASYFVFEISPGAPVDRCGGSLKPLRVLNHLTSSAPTGLLPPFVLGRPPGEEACILTSFCALHTGRREL